MMLFLAVHAFLFSTFAIRAAADLAGSCTGLRVDSIDPWDGVILGRCLDANQQTRLAMIEQSECVWIQTNGRVLQAGFTSLDPTVLGQYCSSCYLAPPTNIACYCKDENGVEDWTNQLDLNDIIWIDGDGNFNCGAWPNNYN